MIGDKFKETKEEIDSKINALLYADSYKNAEILLVDIENHAHKLSSEQLNRICSAALSNDQINGIYICKVPLKRIISRNRDKIDEELYESVMEMIEENNEIPQNPFTIRLKKKDIIYDGRVRQTSGGSGIITLKDKYLGKRGYVVFPMYRQDREDSVVVTIDEIINKGIHSDNDHATRMVFRREFVGRDCIIVLMEG